MLVQLQFELQYAGFYTGHGILYAIPLFFPSSCSYFVILCADSADIFHSRSGHIFSNYWNVYQLCKLWNISETIQ